MDPILSWGLDIIRTIQSAFGHSLDLPMKAISFIGSEAFVISVIPLVYWCVDRRRGARIGLLVLGSAFLNLWIKDIFMEPRPYALDPSVGRAVEKTYSLPSGHSQTSVVFWGSLASFIPRLPGIVLAIAVPLLVGFSRVYLGVHYPTDALAGWAVGGLILAAWLAYGSRLEALLMSFDLRYRLVAAAVTALGMNALLPGDTSIGGAFLGAAVGFGAMGKAARFDAGGPIGKRALRYLAGLAGTAVAYLGPKLLIGDAFPAQEPLVRFLRYAIVGAWVSFGAPWCFLKLGLAAPDPAR